MNAAEILAELQWRLQLSIQADNMMALVAKMQATSARLAATTQTHIANPDGPKYDQAMAALTAIEASLATIADQFAANASVTQPAATAGIASTNISAAPIVTNDGTPLVGPGGVPIPQ